MMKIDEEKIKKILERGTNEIIEKDHLEESLRSGKKLRIKFGIDPTSPDLHLGHAVPLKKIKQFQDAGHEIILIIGDFTARIGDPSGRESERKPITPKEVKKNLKKYLLLAGKIINIKKTKIRYNSKWLGKNSSTILELARAGSVQYVMHREDFKERIAGGNDITILETMYPLFQGYDSVVVKADVEVGGVDQKLNLLAGRKLQRHFGKQEQDILTTPLLIGTDGKKKMSKSFGNYIALDEKPDKMFAKIMSVPDDLIENYLLLLTNLSSDEIKEIKIKLPLFERKKRLAAEIVSFLYSPKKSADAKESFERTFSKKEIPTDLKIYQAKAGEPWIEFLTREKLVGSKSEAKRLIDGGGVDLEKEKIFKASDKIIKSGVVKIGKHRFIKLEVK